MPAAPSSAPPDQTNLDRLRGEALGLALRHAPSDGLHASAVPGLQLIRASVPAQRLPAIYEPGLVLVLQGRKQATLGHEVLSYDPLHCLLVSMTLQPQGQIIDASPALPYLCLRLNSDAATLAALVLEVGPAASPTARSTPPMSGLNLCPVSPPLMEAAVRLLRLLDAPQDVPVLAPLVQREVFYRVLTGPLGPRLRALATGDSMALRVARAIELLKQRFDQPLRIDELAAVARMSPSSLHLHFKQLTTQSPLQYQKLLRLQQARRLMLGEGLDAASAAYRVGYESPSQFSREYRRLFGASPRAEMAQIRDALPG
jgi:AraC-like DNA-binding protein